MGRQIQLKCWENGAVCGKCNLSLDGYNNNQPMIFSVTDSTAMAVIAVILAIFGILSNSITMTALLWSQRVRSMVSTPFILSLNGADLLFSVFSLPVLSIRFFTRDWNVLLGPHFCKIHPFLFYGVLGASVLSLMVVTVNRVTLLLFREKVGSVFTVRVSMVIVALCWLIPLGFLIPSLSGAWGMAGLKDYTQSCTIMDDEEGENPKKLFQTLFVIIPVILMIICNIIIFIKLKCVPNRDLLEDEDKKAENLFLLTIFLVFVVFLLAFLPKMIWEYIDKCYKHPSVHAFTYVINWTRVIFDPMVFLLTQETYRSAVKRLFTRCFPSLLEHKEDETDGANRESKKTMRLESFSMISTNSLDM